MILDTNEGGKLPPNHEVFSFGETIFYNRI